ncbi:MAG: hypothetical protein U0P81_05275 [Holophagaceae bacterium]
MPNYNQEIINIKHSAMILIQSWGNLDAVTHIQPLNDETSLEPIKSYLTDVLDMVNDLNGITNLSPFIRTHDLADNLVNSLQFFTSLADRIAVYRVAVASLSDREKIRALKNPLIELIINNYNILLRSYQVIGSMSSIRQAKIESEKVKATIGDYHQTMISTYEQAKKLLRDAEDVLTKSKQASAVTTINIYSDLFQEQSKKHQKSAKVWMFTLGITLLIGMGLLYFSYSSKFPFHNFEDESILLIQSIGTRGIILSLTIYMATVCVKNFRANKHNEVINIHRAKALQTFQAFINSADRTNTDAYNYILIQCVNAIFSHQTSGFSDPEKEISSNPIIIDLLQNSILKKKPE